MAEYRRIFSRLIVLQHRWQPARFPNERRRDWE
jgi:hypothetical protein